MMGQGRAKLVGVLIYVREYNNLRVLYLALKPTYTISWQNTCHLLYHLLELLKQIAKSIKGVQTLQVSVAARDVVFKI